jgi:hypothetical protein
MVPSAWFSLQEGGVVKISCASSKLPRFLLLDCTTPLVWQHCDVAINPGDSQNVFTWSFLDWYEDWLEKFMMGEVDLPFFQLRNRRPL